MGKRRKGGTLPGMGDHGRTTPIWLFVVHLVVVFVCTVGALWAFDKGGQFRMIGYLFSATWLAAFILTALDDVRITAFEWTRVRLLVMLDAVRSMGNTQSVRSAQDKGVHGVSAEPPRPHLDVDRG